MLKQNITDELTARTFIDTNIQDPNSGTRLATLRKYLKIKTEQPLIGDKAVSKPDTCTNENQDNITNVNFTQHDQMAAVRYINDIRNLKTEYVIDSLEQLKDNTVMYSNGAYRNPIDALESIGELQSSNLSKQPRRQSNSNPLNKYLSDEHSSCYQNDCITNYLQRSYNNHKASMDSTNVNTSTVETNSIKKANYSCWNIFGKYCSYID